MPDLCDYKFHSTRLPNEISNSRVVRRDAKKIILIPRLYKLYDLNFRLMKHRENFRSHNALLAFASYQEVILTTKVDFFGSTMQ
jgi:hypothetical protein